jgi:hypothetical protein
VFDADIAEQGRPAVTARQVAQTEAGGIVQNHIVVNPDIAAFHHLDAGAAVADDQIAIDIAAGADIVFQPQPRPFPPGLTSTVGAQDIAPDHEVAVAAVQPETGTDIALAHHIFDDQAVGAEDLEDG